MIEELTGNWYGRLEIKKDDIMSTAQVQKNKKGRKRTDERN
jgi:hypothetical protein